MMANFHPVRDRAVCQYPRSSMGMLPALIEPVTTVTKLMPSCASPKPAVAAVTGLIDALPKLFSPVSYWPGVSASLGAIDIHSVFAASTRDRVANEGYTTASANHCGSFVRHTGILQ